jgi:hypothetical protein
MLTKHQIIDETVEFYSNNARSLNENGRCFYNSINNTKCAFSRCCTNDSKFTEHQKADAQTEAVLLPQYSHYPLVEHIIFWNTLQNLHDNRVFWNNNTLTTQGKDYVILMKSTFKD